MKQVTAVAALAVVASVLISKGSAQTTAIGQFVANNLVWSDDQPDPCLQSNATTDQVDSTAELLLGDPTVGRQQ